MRRGRLEPSTVVTLEHHEERCRVGRSDLGERRPRSETKPAPELQRILLARNLCSALLGTHRAHTTTLRETAERLPSGPALHEPPDVGRVRVPAHRSASAKSCHFWPTSGEPYACPRLARRPGQSEALRREVR